METPPLYPQHYYPTASPAKKNDLITFAFALSLISFVVVLLINVAYFVILSPLIMRQLNNTKDIWNLLFVLFSIFGFIGALGFLLGLIGTLNEIHKKSLTQYFSSFMSIGMGFFGFLIMIEYLIRNLKSLIN